MEKKDIRTVGDLIRYTDEEKSKAKGRELIQLPVTDHRILLADLNLAPVFPLPIKELAILAATVTAGAYYNGEIGAMGSTCLYISAKIWQGISGLGSFGRAAQRNVKDVVGEGWAVGIAFGSGKLSLLTTILGVFALSTPRPWADIDYTQTRAIQAAACEILKGKNHAEARIPYFEQAAWSFKGKEAGNVHISMDIVRRDTDNFAVLVSVNSGKPRTELFRPQDSMFPGYQNATVLNCTP